MCGVVEAWQTEGAARCRVRRVRPATLFRGPTTCSEMSSLQFVTLLRFTKKHKNIQFDLVLKHLLIASRLVNLLKNTKKHHVHRKVTGKKWRELPLGGFPIRIQKTYNHSPYVDRHYFCFFIVNWHYSGWSILQIHVNQQMCWLSDCRSTIKNKFLLSIDTGSRFRCFCAFPLRSVRVGIS